MTIVNAKHNSNIKPRPEDMLAISQEISLKFSPNEKNKNQLSPDLRSYYYNIKNPKTNNALFPLHKLDQSYHRPEELYEISSEISRHFAPKLLITTPEIFLLPVDPYHLYVYWQINQDMALNIHPEDRFNIRFYWRPNAHMNDMTPKVWFDLNVDHQQSRQKIRLPICNTSYSAALGKLDTRNRFTELAHSNIIHVPPAPQIIRPILPPQPINDMSANTDFSSAPINNEPFNNGSDAAPKQSTNQGEQNIAQGWAVKLHQGQSSFNLGVINKIDALFTSLANSSDISLELLADLSTYETKHSYSRNASGIGL